MIQDQHDSNVDPSPLKEELDSPPEHNDDLFFTIAMLVIIVVLCVICIFFQL